MRQTTTAILAVALLIVCGCLSIPLSSAEGKGKRSKLYDEWNIRPDIGDVCQGEEFPKIQFHEQHCIGAGVRTDMNTCI